MIKLGDIIAHQENITPDNLAYNIRLLLPVAKIEIKKIAGDEWKLASIEGK